jgi:glycosyltransferase involved in cell wall biosynthesis
LRNSVKILVIGQLPPVINGQSLVTKSILDVLIKENYHVDFLPLTSLNHSNSILLRLNKFGFYFKSFVDFIRLTYSGNYIVYLNGARSIGGTFRNYPFLMFSKIFGNKTVLHFHCGDIDEFLESQNLVVRFLLKLVYRLPDKIIILSSLIRNNFRQIENRNNIVVIKNAVDIIGKPKILSASESVKLIYMSNLILSKGYFDVLAAVNYMVNDLGLKNITCDFCGEFLTSFDDPKSNSIESMKSDFFEFIRKNNLSCHVNYHNLVLDQQKADLLAKSHFFILPTNYSTEAQPLSIIEAIANGCVIITTNFRAIPDMVIDNFNGKFVEYGNPLSITQNISYFVNNPSVYESSSSNSVLHYQKYFTIDNFNNKVVELFEQIRN